MPIPSASQTLIPLTGSQVPPVSRFRNAGVSRSIPTARRSQRYAAAADECSGLNTGASVSPASATASRSCTSGIEKVSALDADVDVGLRRPRGSARACPPWCWRCAPRASRPRASRRAWPCTPASVSAIAIVIIDVLVISAGSRPTFSQWPLEHAEQVLGALGVAEQVAAVGVLGDHPQRLALPAAADQDRDVAAERLGVVVGAVDRVVLAGDGGLLLGEHRPRDAQVVLQALEALLQRREREAVGVVLTLEPARADAVERAPAAR